MEFSEVGVLDTWAPCVNPTTDAALHVVYRCHGVDSRLLEVCLAVDLARIGAGTRNAMGSLSLDF